MSSHNSELFETETHLNELYNHINNHLELVPSLGFFRTPALLQMVEKALSSLNEDLKRAKDIERIREEIILEAERKAARILEDAQRRAQSQDFVIRAQKEAESLLASAKSEQKRIFRETQEFQQQTITQTFLHSDEILAKTQALLQQTQKEIADSRLELRQFSNQSQQDWVNQRKEA